jgi:predicted  nucleic acid-binding Zn-ribbon protein
MIEAALYFALGALCVSLLLFVILPIVSGRARRLAIHELERQAPVSLSEITAQKDQMRARFAVELNRQEKRADQLQIESQQHLVTAEKWRVFAERVETEFEKLKNDYAGLKKKIDTAETNLEKQREIAKSALKTMTGKEKKRLFELEDEVEELRSEKSAATTQIGALKAELNNARSTITEMERHMPSLEELSLRKELKALAEDVSAYIKSAPPPAPAPAPVASAATQVAPAKKEALPEQSVAAAQPAAAPAANSTRPDTIVAPAAVAAKPDETAATQESPEKPVNEQDKSDDAMSVIPVFLKPASERQSAEPAKAKSEPAVETREQPTPQTPTTEDLPHSNISEFPSERSRADDHAPDPDHAYQSEKDASGQDSHLQSTVANTVVAKSEPGTESSAQSDDHSHATSGHTGSETAAEPSLNGVTNHAVMAAKPIKQDKPSKSKKPGFAGFMAAVSRGSRGTSPSVTNSKLKSGSAHLNGKGPVRHSTARPAAGDSVELNGSAGNQTAAESARGSAKETVPASGKRKKIIRFGKKTRRIKAASASS